MTVVFIQNTQAPVQGGARARARTHTHTHTHTHIQTYTQLFEVCY